MILYTYNIVVNSSKGFCDSIWKSKSATITLDLNNTNECNKSLMKIDLNQCRWKSLNAAKMFLSKSNYYVEN